MSHGNELPEGWTFSPAIGGAFVSQREGGGQYALTLALLRALLASQGLTIVGPAERVVLDAASAFVPEALEHWRDYDHLRSGKTQDDMAFFAVSELFRRQVKP